jgi:hypothetical protein
MPVNPFKPTAGKMPPILIGREDVIADFSEGLANGAGAPGRLMLISGQRGFGKTVLLTELARIAEANGWLTIRETAAKGMCDRIVRALSGSGPHVSGIDVSPSVEIAGVAGASLGHISVSAPSSLDIREAVSKRFSRIKPGKGILFTVDETQAACRDELVAISTAVQQIIVDQDMTSATDAEKHGIAFVFAGLPSLVDDLVNDDVLTFLRRAMRHDLGPIMVPDVRNAYQRSVQESGLSIGDEEALAAAQASRGYPYLVQLVGYYMWQSAQRRKSARIEGADVARATEDAGIAFQDAVCAPAYKGLTAAQRSFLDMMAQDWPEPSSVAEVARRAGKSRSWASKYRESLIGSHVIEGMGGGQVAFAIPYLGDYLQQQLAATKASV